jgi:heme-degrading monooxygenase HmoA
MTTAILFFVFWAQTAAATPADTATLCKDAKDATLCAELVTIRQRDQEVRRRWIAEPGNEALRAEVAKVDEENVRRVEAILARAGWPGPSLVGKAAGSAAWLVIQHADLATQKRYLDLMTRAVESKELEPSLYGTTVDRIRIREGKPQLYGTQFHEMNGVQVPEAIEDEANVEARRAAIGMTSLSQYTSDLGEAFKKPAAMSPVIAREWRGRVPSARANEYGKYLYDEGITRIRSIKSNLGVQVFRRMTGDVTEFVVISYWPSRAAIHEFAGADIEKAHMLKRDPEFLIEPDANVRHYEVSFEQFAKPEAAQ